jgi:hypothetical protein
MWRRRTVSRFSLISSRIAVHAIAQVMHAAPSMQRMNCPYVIAVSPRARQTDKSQDDGKVRAAQRRPRTSLPPRAH